jgi:hypothetical protein
MVDVFFDTYLIRPLNHGHRHNMDTYLILSGLYRNYQVVKIRLSGARVANCHRCDQVDKM